MGLAGGLDKVDHLVVRVSGYVPPVNKNHLVTFVQLRITPEGKERHEKPHQSKPPNIQGVLVSWSVGADTGNNDG